MFVLLLACLFYLLIYYVLFTSYSFIIHLICSGGTLLSSDFESTAADPKAEGINQLVTCVSINVEVSRWLFVVSTFLFNLLYFEQYWTLFECYTVQMLLYFCTQRTPGDLSVLLLTELKEIVKTYCQSPTGVKNSKITPHNTKVKEIVFKSHLCIHCTFDVLANLCLTVC